MRQRSNISVGVVMFALVAAGCGEDDAGSPDGSSAFPMTIQNCGKEITIFAQPERIMTVGNIAVNLLHAAGADDRIAVRAGPHDGPLSQEVAAAVQDAEVLDDDDPSAETVIGTGVDTVVSYGISSTDGLAEAEISSYVETTACDPDGTFEQVFDEVERLGELIGTDDEAADGRGDAGSDRCSGGRLGGRRVANCGVGLLLR